jgi:hypothetical protein
MARTTQEIFDLMLAEKAKRSQLNGLSSTSATAIYRLFMWVVAYAIYVHETFFDIHKADVNALINSKRLGTPEWYVDIAKEFQLGYDLEVLADNTLGYGTIDEAAKIVSRASFKEKEGGGVLTLKVATGELGDLKAFSSEHLLQFANYMERRKFAGTEINKISLPGDILRINAEIYYQGIYSQAVIEQRLNDKIRNYELNFPSDGMLYKAEFVRMLLNVEGIADVKINDLTVVQGETTTVIDRKYETASGYFYYDNANSTITYSVA